MCVGEFPREKWYENDVEFQTFTAMNGHNADCISSLWRSDCLIFAFAFPIVKECLSVCNSALSELIYSVLQSGEIGRDAFLLGDLQAVNQLLNLLIKWQLLGLANACFLRISELSKSLLYKFFLDWVEGVFLLLEQADDETYRRMRANL